MENVQNFIFVFIRTRRGVCVVTNATAHVRDVTVHKRKQHIFFFQLFSVFFPSGVSISTVKALANKLNAAISVAVSIEINAQGDEIIRAKKSEYLVSCHAVNAIFHLSPIARATQLFRDYHLLDRKMLSNFTAVSLFCFSRKI